MSFDSIIIHDESVKTGFTYSIYEGYLFRNCNTEVKTSLYALFDFYYYRKINTKQKNFHALADIKALEMDEVLIPSRIPSPVSKDRKLVIRKVDIEKAIESCKHNGRLDVTLMMTNSQVMYFICNKFKLKIERLLEEDSGKDSVLLYSPSAEGRVLALITALLLKLEGKQVKFYKSNDDESDNKTALKIAIDISIDTGFTLAYEWCMDVNKPFIKEDISNYCDAFDEILTVVRRADNDFRINDDLFDD
jgi:hypothetical protein